MIGNYTYGSIPFCMDNGGEAEDFNWRYLILRALKQNLEAITFANGFRAEIKVVKFGGAESLIQNGEILIYSISDTLTKTGEEADRNGRLMRPSFRIRNIHVKFRLMVKSEACSGITDEMLELRENYADAVIKGLYGRRSSARQLYWLLLDGISVGSGLTALDISQFKECGFSGDLELEAEMVFTYREKFN